MSGALPTPGAAGPYTKGAADARFLPYLNKGVVGLNASDEIVSFEIPNHLTVPRIFFQVEGDVPVAAAMERDSDTVIFWFSSPIPDSGYKLHWMTMP
ncbi:MAG TPA: hypothetical protein PKE26_11860 [Kiritimatiellia bacterium]|nr:hypothetical protein [Kiritimatiellia bacterium]HMO99796.1 hypothetical protein [Kiritimatiellia bacterium]HMP97225.1 hypothetical protein [Kiritimatiellia bacterium]